MYQNLNTRDLMIMHLRRPKYTRYNELTGEPIEKGGEPFATFVAKRIDNTVYIGWSMCHHQYDTFNKRYGIEVALARITKGKSRELPAALYPHIEEFTNRCRRYFKDVSCFTYIGLK